MQSAARLAILRRRGGNSKRALRAPISYRILCVTQAAFVGLGRIVALPHNIIAPQSDDIWPLSWGNPRLWLLRPGMQTSNRIRYPDIGAARFADVRPGWRDFRSRYLDRVPLYEPRFRRLNRARRGALRGSVARAAPADDITDRRRRTVISSGYAGQSFAAFVSLDNQWPVLLGYFPSFT